MNFSENLQPGESLVRVAFDDQYRLINTITTESGYTVWTVKLDVIDGHLEGETVGLNLWVDPTNFKFIAQMKVMLEIENLQNIVKEQLLHNVALALRDYDFVVKIGANHKGTNEVKIIDRRVERKLHLPAFM